MINPEPLPDDVRRGLMTKYPVLALRDFRYPVRGVYSTVRAWVRVWRFRRRHGSGGSTE
jgi:hypothetical protein